MQSFIVLFCVISSTLVVARRAVPSQTHPSQPAQPPCVRVVDLQELAQMPCRPNGPKNNAALFAIDGWANLLRNATTTGKQIFSAFMIPPNFQPSIWSPRLPITLPPPCQEATPAYTTPRPYQPPAAAPLACPHYQTAANPPHNQPSCVRIVDLEEMLRMPCRFSNTDVSLLAVNGWNKMIDGASSMGSQVYQAFLVPAQFTINSLFDIKNLFSVGGQSLLQQIIKVPVALRTFIASTFDLLRQNIGTPLCSQQAVQPVQAPVMYACPPSPIYQPAPVPANPKIDGPLQPFSAVQEAKVNEAKINVNLEESGGRMEAENVDAPEGRMESVNSNVDMPEGRVEAAVAHVDVPEGRMEAADAKVDLEHDAVDLNLEGSKSLDSGLDSPEGRMGDAKMSHLKVGTNNAELNLDEGKVNEDQLDVARNQVVNLGNEAVGLGNEAIYHANGAF